MSKFADKSVEDLKALSVEKQTAFTALIEAAGDAPTPEQVEQASAAAAEIDEIEAAITERAEAAAKFEALKGRKFGSESVEASEDETEEAAEDETEEAAEETEVEAEADAEVEASTEDAPAEPVEASAKPKKVAQFAKKVARPVVESSTPTVSIVAATEVPGFSAGTSLEGIADISKAVVSKMKGFTPPSGDGTTENLQKFGVASLTLPFEDEFVIDRGTDDMEVLYRAANERRLEGNSLTAAGGWCSPSETLYDLAADESLEGILSVPEVQVKRGGIRYTEGPQFADFYANAGFIQTEAQAIAGNTKPCYEVDCPTFDEVRLDAVGLCIKVPILTNAAYPELVQRFTSGTLIAHQHMVNLEVITRMVAFAGAARAFTGLGSTVSDSLEALELLADQRRQAYRLPLNRSMEVVLPFWVKGAYRSDLARRQGVAAEAISDTQITAHFTARNLQVSFVYDWQLLPDTDVVGPPAVDAEAYPATYQALMYPAGTFIKGVSDVINLQAVYDAASLAVNTYTGLFVEQGLLVAKMQYDADLLELPVCNAGRVGAADITCA